MRDAELIARLRKADEYGPLGHDGWEAADRIEALTKERDELIEWNGQASVRAERAEARAERLEEALRDIFEKPRNADWTYAELISEMKKEARTALEGDSK